jgi:hypothetical protein
VDAAQLELEINPQVPAGQIPDAAALPVVPRSLRPAARAAAGFFSRLVSEMIRACGSPKIPTIVRAGMNRGNRYASRSSRLEGVRERIHELHRPATRDSPMTTPSATDRNRPKSPTHFAEDPQKETRPGSSHEQLSPLAE